MQKHTVRYKCGLAKAQITLRSQMLVNEALSVLSRCSLRMIWPETGIFYVHVHARGDFAVFASDTLQVAVCCWRGSLSPAVSQCD